MAPDLLVRLPTCRRDRGLLSILGLVIIVLLLTHINSREKINNQQARPVPAEVASFLKAVRPLTVTPAQRARMLSLVAAVDRLLRRYHVAYFVADGSAIGAHRHGGLIPFDDDFDISVLESNRSLLQRFVFSKRNLAKMGLEMMVMRRFSKVFFRRFIAETDVKYKEFEYRWPWVDVNFLKSNGSHLQVYNPQFVQDNFLAQVDEVFPLVDVDIDGLLLPLMRCSRAVLQRHYGAWTERCCTGNWNHRTENYFLPNRSSVCIACSALRGFYPFVERIDAEREAVKIGERVLRTRTLRQEVGCG